MKTCARNVTKLYAPHDSTKPCTIAFYRVNRGRCFRSQDQFLCTMFWRANRSVHTTFNRVGEIKCEMLDDTLFYTTVSKYEPQHGMKGPRLTCTKKRKKKWLHGWMKNRFSKQKRKILARSKNERSETQQRVTSRFLQAQQRRRPLSFPTKKSTLSSLILCRFHFRFWDNCMRYWARTWLHTTKKSRAVRLIHDSRTSTGVLFTKFRF